MFNKTNLFIFNTESKEKESKNFVLDIFSSKYEIAIWTFLIYLSGVLFQIFRLIWWFTTDLKLWNLMFFSFSNSLNDFWIFFWISLIFFLLSFWIVFILNIFLKGFNVKNNTCITVLSLFLSFAIVMSIYYYANGWNFWSILNVWITSIPYVLSVCLSGFIIYKWVLEKKVFYTFLVLFMLYWFFLLLLDPTRYYGCNQIRCNDEIKNCILFEYKNDKYWFTWDGDIYNLNEFKAFYTSHYFKDNITTWTESCDIK